MLNLSLLACTKVELQVLTVCIAVNGEKVPSSTVTLTLVQQCPMKNLVKVHIELPYATTMLKRTNLAPRFCKIRPSF